MDRKMITFAALLGASGIILGAFGAHELKKVLSPEALVTFETGVKYQMYHALFLLFAGTTALISAKAKKAIFIIVATGVLFFSGSVYLLACNNIFSVDFRFLGPITPIGGLLLISAWIVLFLNIIRAKR